MRDVERFMSDTVISLLDEELLTRESYLDILTFILESYRFNVKFLKQIQRKIYEWYEVVLNDYPEACPAGGGLGARQ